MPDNQESQTDFKLDICKIHESNHWPYMEVTCYACFI